MIQFYKQKDKNYFYLVYRSFCLMFIYMETALYQLEGFKHQKIQYTKNSKFLDNIMMFVFLDFVSRKITPISTTSKNAITRLSSYPSLVPFLHSDDGLV